MLLSKKIHIAVGSLVAASILIAGGLYAHKHFKDNYLLLNQEEIQNIQMNIQILRMQAYEAGQAACGKSS